MKNIFHASRFVSKKSLEARFFAKVDSSAGPDGCWPWKAHINADGYGMLIVDGKADRSHRISYRIHKGEIPDGLVVMHTCDNPGCVNPAHLVLGTQAENVYDMISKGRKHVVKGDEHGMAKLTEADVVKIRHLRSVKGISYKDLSRKFGVSAEMIGFIVRRQSWKHI